MNDFTKEELETILHALDYYDVETFSVNMPSVMTRIACMINNYCEHESDGLLYYRAAVDDERSIWLQVNFPLPGSAVFARKTWNLTREECHEKCKRCGAYFK